MHVVCERAPSLSPVIGTHVDSPASNLYKLTRSCKKVFDHDIADEEPAQLGELLTNTSIYMGSRPRHCDA